MMRWPFMLKRTHDQAITGLSAMYDGYLCDADRALQAEYGRATADGRKQVHAWAREMTSVLYTESHPNIFRNKALAAIQQAEDQFRPSRPKAITTGGTT